MARKVENPFKEQRIPGWIRYVIAGLAGFSIAWFLFGHRGGSTVHNGLTFRGPSNPGLRPANPIANAVREGLEKHDIRNERVYETDDNIGEESEDFPDLEQEEFLGWVRKYYERLEFTERPVRHKLTKTMLDESLVMGCDYIAANQKETGNFNYQYDFVTKEMDKDDSPVRQAGALWGMTLCFQSQPNKSLYRDAVEKGFSFFQGHMVDGPAPGSHMVKYPGFSESQLGANALYGLALVDYLRTIRDNEMTSTLPDVDAHLSSTLEFLKYMQNENLHFSDAYYFEDEEKSEDSSPYFDGETLLCLTKAAKYLEGQGNSLIPLIEEAAPVIAKSYTVDKWRNDEHDSDKTKGFYQWSSMVFTEYYLAKWKDYEYYGDLVLVLAHWIVHTHAILQRNRNTGYAYEGIISAFQIARVRGHEEALADLAYTIDEGLYELGRWQVGGPLAYTNKFLVNHPTVEKIAVGGIMNAKNLSPLRIDTTQHQMHAVMMALETVFGNA